jgi:hypothetical protein
MARFVKGQSGNPGGRPKELKDVQSLARTKTLLAVQTLVEIAQNGKSESARVAAASALLDRGFGKPHQALKMEADSTLSVNIVRFGDRIGQCVGSDPSYENRAHAALPAPNNKPNGWINEQQRQSPPVLRTGAAREARGKDGTRTS